MDKELTMGDVIALRDLETEHHENTSLKAIAWVIGVVIVLAIIAFFLRGHWDGRRDDYRHESNYRCEHGEYKGRLAFIEKQVEKLEEKQYFTFGKLEKLYGETKCYEKYNTHEVEEMEHRIYPQNYIGCCENERFEERRERRGNCGKRFERKETFTPSTQEITVTEDCGCGNA